MTLSILHVADVLFPQKQPPLDSSCPDLGGLREAKPYASQPSNPCRSRENKQLTSREREVTLATRTCFQLAMYQNCSLSQSQPDRKTHRARKACFDPSLSLEHLSTWAHARPSRISTRRAAVASSRSFLAFLVAMTRTSKAVKAAQPGRR